jgi:hypothetical protein
VTQNTDLVTSSYFFVNAVKIKQNANKQIIDHKRISICKLVALMLQLHTQAMGDEQPHS